MQRFQNIYHSLTFRLTFSVGLILLVCIFTWAYFDIRYQKKNAIDGVMREADRLGNTIKLGAHYAMMLNSRDDINQIINNIARQKEIETIRIFNKQGKIKYSNILTETDMTTNIKAEACYICHREEPPLETVALDVRKRIINDPSGYRRLGIISPIYNEPGCSTDPCHFHQEDKKILGALDVVVSLKDTDNEILSYERRVVAMAVIVFLCTSTIMVIFLFRFVKRPIKNMITGTRLIGQGKYDHHLDADRKDEIGRLAMAINQMGKEIGEKREELRRQRDEYHNLFEVVPCYITVQDRDYKLIQYNREFADRFGPKPGDYCYQAYKGRSEKCERCPVSRTFEDGESHYSEEIGISKDGTRSYWVVRTSPIKNTRGEVTAAMELCLDITERKQLEYEVKRSEEKYRMIFDNIPNPVFVLDANNLEILDCNDSVEAVYEFGKKELLGTSFMDFFEDADRERYALEMKTSNFFTQVRHISKDGKMIFVNMRISSSDYQGREVLLVITSDITQRLMAEQQLIQAGKMATLGEMATGVAHELNQPLSVIKTASSYLMKKVNRNEKIEDEILGTMAEEIDGHVDRASRIIDHMREFGRKPDVKKEKAQANEALNKALDIFSQQLKLRQIEVVKELEENLPLIIADSNRLEQIFINLLINARDAIEEKWNHGQYGDKGKRIVLKTNAQLGKVTIQVKDNGEGIPESVVDKIFEPFFTTKKVGQGTGLGLSISYGIVQDYDGTIRVESQAGEGSNFIIQFPVADES